MAIVFRTRDLWNCTLGICLAAVALGGLAQQPYPNRPIRLIVPLAPGGPSTILAHTMAKELTGSLGQNVLVDNRAGAGGTVGSDVAAKSPGDGYTMMLISASTYGINASLYAKLPFDARKDLTPVTILAAGQSLVTVHPSVPVKTLKELIALAKTRPNDLNYGAGGTTGQLHMELLKLRTGMSIANIPYKGAGPALIDQIAGHVQVSFLNMIATTPLVHSGKLRALAVNGTKRSGKHPAVSTLRESGVEGFDEVSGHMIVVPSATPRDIIARLNREMVKALNTPEVTARLAAEGAEVIGNTPEEAAVIVRREFDKWADVIRAAKIPLQ